MSNKQCKCSHLKSEHEKVWRICKLCPCSNYLDSSFPKKSDKFFHVWNCCAIGFLIAAMVASGFVLSLMPEDLEATITPKEFLDVVFTLLIGVVGLIIIGRGFEIYEYLRDTKRRII